MRRERSGWHSLKIGSRIHSRGCRDAAGRTKFESGVGKELTKAIKSGSLTRGRWETKGQGSMEAYIARKLNILGSGRSGWEEKDGKTCYRYGYCQFRGMQGIAHMRNDSSWGNQGSSSRHRRNNPIVDKRVGIARFNGR